MIRPNFLRRLVPSASTTADGLVAALVFLFPAIYEVGWRPIVRIAVIWIMLVVLVILIRVPLPTSLPWPLGLTLGS
jgi:uncharacterized membrane protein YhaH (DUF805 family)